MNTVTKPTTSYGGPVSRELFDQDAPGVEIIESSDRNEAVTVVCRRLIGVLHRRLLPKFGRLQSEVSYIASQNGTAAEPERVDLVLDLSHGAASDWNSRVGLYRSLGETASSAQVDERFGVRIRGLREVENAVLVDGRPVPAAIVDLAVAAIAFVEPLRAENGELLTVVHPLSRGADEEELWRALFQLCQDRLGIHRGVLNRSSTIPMVRTNVSAVA